MSLYANKSVEVEKLDNGYVLTWEDKTKQSLPDLGGLYPRSEPKTRGREIYTTSKALHKRLKELL